jgi:hypothetical protein
MHHPGNDGHPVTLLTPEPGHFIEPAAASIVFFKEELMEY